MRKLSTLFSSPLNFDWDSGNDMKNQQSHGVRCIEAEQVFSVARFRVQEDVAHSQSEPRYVAYGRTAGDRLLTVCFTIRNRKIRVISARDMSRKERRFYAQVPQEEIEDGGASTAE